MVSLQFIVRIIYSYLSLSLWSWVLNIRLCVCWEIALSLSYILFLNFDFEMISCCVG